ncbi:MAG: hypothetical protein EA398_12240 [Deltaproteobacteria bacterium]|nr:MAG: hypothetical protein EA398_12240 [Deltaproteobacteria bacterium]
MPVFVRSPFPAHPMKTSTRRLLVHALLVLALGLISACGDEDSGGPLPSGTAGDPGTASGGEPTSAESTGASVPSSVSDPTSGPPGGGSGGGVESSGRPEPTGPGSTEGTDAPLPDPSLPPLPSGTLSLSSVQPSSGPSSGGTAIVIRGSGFDFRDDVVINGRLAEAIDVVDEFTIFAMTPPNPAGFYSVRVVGEGRAASLPNGFRYLEPTTFESIEPGSGPETGGTPVTIRGASFTPETVVTIGGRSAIDVQFMDEETLVALVPAGSPGLADVRISGPNGSAIGEGVFRWTAEPLVRSVHPAAGSAMGGEEVVLRGRSLGAVSEVRFGSQRASLLASDDEELTVRTPAGAPGLVAVTVTSDQGSARLDDAFRYVAPSEHLSVVGVVPGWGSLSGGDQVTIAGSFPAGVDEVVFGGVPAAIEESRPNALLVRTPAGAMVGWVDVEVVSGEEGALLPGAFEYRPDLVVEAMEPGRGDVSGGEVAELTGDGFLPPLSVRVGAFHAEILGHGPGSVTLRVPPGSAGSADVVVTSAGRRAVLDGGWLYTQQPAVFAMTPPRGAIAGNTQVLLSGRGLSGVEAVLVDGREAPLVEERDPSLLAFRTPPGSEGAATVEVVLADGTLAVDDPFFYFNPFLPGGGWWGDVILGAVNVTVLDAETAEPVEDAFVTLSVRATETVYTARTNAAGQATVSGDGVSGGQSVHVVAENYSAATVQDVNAENIVVYLTYICTDPDDPRCGDGDPPPPPPLGTIRGQLTGIDKIADPGPGRVVMGIVYPTFGIPWNALRDPLGAPPSPMGANATIGDGPYALRVLPGEQAAVAFCGVYDQATSEFDPRWMGVARGLFVPPEGEVVANIDCDVRLNRTATVKLMDSPVPTNPTMTNWVTPYLDFGSEGVFGGLWRLQGRGEEFAIDKLPAFSGVLSDVTLTVAAGASGPGDGLPTSTVMDRTIRDISRQITLPSLMSPVRLTRPSPFGFGRVEGRRLEWEVTGPVAPNLQYLYIMDAGQENVLWEMWVPGDQNFVNLPYWPADAPGAPLQPGESFVLIVFAVDVIGFTFDDFEYRDLFYDRWSSWSINGWFLTWD